MEDTGGRASRRSRLYFSLLYTCQLLSGGTISGGKWLQGDEYMSFVVEIVRALWYIGIIIIKVITY